MLQSTEDFIWSVDGLVSHMNYEKNCRLFFQDGKRKYVGDSELEKEFQKYLIESVASSVMESKVYSYKNAIISLYGALERFIEYSIEEYLRVLYDKAPRFNLLPKEIRKNHFDVSIDYINRIKRTRSKDNSVLDDISLAVKNIHNCLEEIDDYDLNYAAYRIHTSNFRYDSIHEIFNRIGIEDVSKLALSDSDLAESLKERFGFSEDVGKKELVLYLTRLLSDLAQRRNEIAHGVKIDEIVSEDILLSMAKVVKSYGKAIDKIMLRKIYEYDYENGVKISLDKPSKIYPEHKVLEFSDYNPISDQEDVVNIKKGATIYAVNKASSTKVIYGKLLSILCPHGEVETLSSSYSGPYSIKVDFGGNVGKSFLRRKIYCAG